MAFKKKIEVKQEIIPLPNEIPYKDFTIIVEPHELGVRAILCTSWGTVVTQEYGEREDAIEKVKAYAE